MFSKIYKLTLFGFITFLLTLNIFCFVTTLNPKSLINPFFIESRTHSVFLLLKFMMLERGIVLRHTDRNIVKEFIKETAEKYGVDPLLVHAIIEVESGYNEFAISRTGAMGLMQIMPYTFFEMGFKSPYDYKENIEAGIKYLSIQIKKFNDLKLALSAYNAGPGRVYKKMQIPEILETQNYVKKVLEIYTPENYDIK